MAPPPPISKDLAPLSFSALLARYTILMMYYLYRHCLTPYFQPKYLVDTVVASSIPKILPALLPSQPSPSIQMTHLPITVSLSWFENAIQINADIIYHSYGLAHIEYTKRCPNLHPNPSPPFIQVTLKPILQNRGVTLFPLFPTLLPIPTHPQNRGVLTPPRLLQLQFHRQCQHPCHHGSNTTLM